jgi:hypothetical protein
MIWTIKGNRIELNGITEWLLFQRMNQKVNCIDFLSLTDSTILLPNFLYSFSLLALLFTTVDFSLILIVPSGFYILGQLMIKFRIGTILKLLIYPLIIYNVISKFIQIGIFIASFFVLDWWTFIIIPIYLVTLITSVVFLNFHEKIFYKANWQHRVEYNIGYNAGYYDIFKNNAFLTVYKYYAEKYDLNSDFTPDDEEIYNNIWFEAENFMERNWRDLEPFFYESGRRHWRSYLQIDKKEK